MNLKIAGAVLVLTSCAGFSFRICAQHRREIRNLTQLMQILDLMCSALQYRLTPLPQLCEEMGKAACGAVGKVFLSLNAELRTQTYTDVDSAMRQIMDNLEDISRREKRLFRLLGKSLGQFDLPGQIRGLLNVRSECSQELSKLKQNQQERLRSYQTLGLCAGAALVILFI